jgi:hypothetical protein
MTMPFGKYRGLDLSELPDDYFNWLAGRPNLREPLLSAVVDELRARQRNAKTENVIWQFDAADRPLLQEILHAGYRQLSLKYHPDRGGDVVAMQNLNRLMKQLRAVAA